MRLKATIHTSSRRRDRMQMAFIIASAAKETNDLAKAWGANGNELMECLNHIRYEMQMQPKTNAGSLSMNFGIINILGVIQVWHKNQKDEFDELIGKIEIVNQ